MADQFTNKVVVVIDKSIMEEYRKIYFKMNPRCRTFPEYFKNPIPPSWNFVLGKTRMAQNAMKNKYSEFGMWLAARYKIAGLNLDKAVFTYDYYFKTKIRHDSDNYTYSAKALNDSFVRAKVLVDDSSKYLELKFPPHGYDKDNPRLEITIEY